MNIIETWSLWLCSKKGFGFGSLLNIYMFYIQFGNHQEGYRSRLLIQSCSQRTSSLRPRLRFQSVWGQVSYCSFFQLSKYQPYQFQWGWSFFFSPPSWLHTLRLCWHRRKPKLLNDPPPTSVLLPGFVCWQIISWRCIPTWTLTLTVNCSSWR